MSIRFERQPAHCTVQKRSVTKLVEFRTPPGVSMEEQLTWEEGATECLNRKECGGQCPGEEEALAPPTA